MILRARMSASRFAVVDDREILRRIAAAHNCDALRRRQHTRLSFKRTNAKWSTSDKAVAVTAFNRRLQLQRVMAHADMESRAFTVTWSPDEIDSARANVGEENHGFELAGCTRSCGRAAR
jgi:hypothetical protein